MLWRKWYKQLTTVKIHILVRPNYDLTSFLNEEIEMCLFCRNYPHLFRSSVIDFYTLCYFLEPVWWQTIVKKEMRFFSNIDLLTLHFLSPGCAQTSRTQNFDQSEFAEETKQSHVFCHPSFYLQTDDFLARHVMLSEFKRVFFGPFGDLHCAINCISWLLHYPHGWCKTNVVFPRNGRRRTYLNLRISEGVAERWLTSRYGTLV